MTNTIPNVPREWIYRVRDLLYEVANETGELGKEAFCLGSFIPGILSAQSPAGVDGLVIDRYEVTEGGGTFKCQGGELVYYDDVAPLLAIIDGLRGEVAQFKATISDSESVFVNMMRGTIAKPSLRSMVNLYLGEVLNGEDALQLELAKANAERDQQAQRIGELEAVMRAIQRMPADDEFAENVIGLIDATLAAVCAAAPNIAPTSEHSGS